MLIPSLHIQFTSLLQTSDNVRCSDYLPQNQRLRASPALDPQICIIRRHGRAQGVRLTDVVQVDGMASIIKRLQVQLEHGIDILVCAQESKVGTI